jgi:transcriptional regulator with XRE-family HTH domain
VKLQTLTAQRAKTARTTAGVTVSQAARTLGISRAAYYDKEAGQTAFTAPELYLLERGLGVVEGDLYRADGPVRFLSRRIADAAEVTAS